MTTLPDPPTGIRLFRALSGILSVAVVAAVFEVLIRCFGSDTPFSAMQLMLAAICNVGILGTAAVLVLAAGLFVGLLATIPVKAYRGHVQVGLVAGGAGVLSFLLAYDTRTFGQADWLNYSWSNLVLSAAVGVCGGLAVWQLGLSMRPSLMNLTRGCVVLVWICCTAAAGISAHRTRSALVAWAGNEADATVAAAESRPPNFLLVVLDTLRADRVGAYGDSKLTPNLDRLASSSFVYTQAISTAPWTLPSHASMLTGLYPEDHGVNWGNYSLDEKASVLPELLKEKGYSSFAISNNWLLNEANGFARGFDQFVDTTADPRISRWRLALRCGGVEWILPLVGLSRDAGWDQGSAWTNWLLKKRFQRDDLDRPFFAMVNYFEPHDPYRPPRRFIERFLAPEEQLAFLRLHQSDDQLATHACGNRGVFTSHEIDLLRKLYDADVAYQDEALGELLDHLQSAGVLDDTWVIVTSDHGELFGEWEMVYHTASAHYQLLHVPLVVRPPGGTEPRRVASPAQPVDIFMTVLAEAGAAVPPAVTRAYPLWTDPDRPGPRTFCVAQTHAASIAGLAITQRRDMQADLSHWLRWINTVYADGNLLEMDSTGSRSLYNVFSDPAMQTNLAALEGALVDSMTSHFQRWSEAKLAKQAPLQGETKHAAIFGD